MTTASISPGNQAGFAQHPPVVGAARFTDGQVEGSAQSLFIRPCSEFSDDSTTALFGLRHPAFYMLMYGAARPGCRPPATDEAYALLVSVLDRAAGAGRLRVPVDVATRVVHAATTGATLALIGEQAPDRDLSASTRLRDTVIGSIATDPPPVATGADLASRALALDAALAAEDSATLPLRDPETALLRDWLRRLAE